MKVKQMKEVLNYIKYKEDVNLEIIEMFEDDHLQCSLVKINNVDFEFMWYDSLEFLYCYKYSDEMFNTLIDSMKNVIFCIEDNIEL